MFEDVEVILTTRGRTEHQHTLNNLSPSILEHVTLVCYPEELPIHNNNWHDRVKQVIGHPTDIDNIDTVRYWCIQHFTAKHVIFMDDNLCFHARKGGDYPEYDSEYPLNSLITKHFTPNTIRKIHLQMFRWMINNLKSDEYGIVGLSRREGNYRVLEDELDNTRTYAFWGINKKLFAQVEGEYDVSEFKYKGDLYTFIFMLTHGFKNIVSYKYVFGKVGGANTKGGCSIYRDEEMMKREAMLLCDKFPGLVRLKMKRSKSWHNVSDEIHDVVIGWKKSYEHGMRGQQGLSKQ